VALEEGDLLVWSGEGATRRVRAAIAEESCDEGGREGGGERTGPVVLRVPLRERVGVFLVRVSA
jgi:hypothetical protein